MSMLVLVIKLLSLLTHRLLLLFFVESHYAKFYQVIVCFLEVINMMQSQASGTKTLPSMKKDT